MGVPPIRNRIIPATESVKKTKNGGFQESPEHPIRAGLSSRKEFERSIIRECTNAGLKAARDRGRLGGRPSVRSANDLTAARTLLQNPEITVEAVARRLGVAASTLYHHLPGGREAVLSEVRKLR